MHPGRGPRHVPPVDAGGTLHAAGLPIGADPGDDRPRAGPRQAHHAAGLLTYILVEALDTFPQSMPAGRFTRPGCRSVRTRSGSIGRGQDLDRLTTRRGCRRTSWSRPSTRSPGRCRREASRGRVAEQCGPGRRPRADPRQAHRAAGLPTCILVEALDTLPRVDRHAAVADRSWTRATAAGKTSTRSPRAAAGVHPGRCPPPPRNP